MKKAICLNVIIITLILSNYAHSGLIYIPGTAPNSPTTSSDNVIPWGANKEIDHYQQQYDAYWFGGESGYFSEIWFRTGNERFNEDVFTVSGFDIQLGFSTTTQAHLGGHSTYSEEGDLANNLGSDFTLVYDGHLDLIGTGKEEPDYFNVRIDIDDTFYYNGTDNLILDLKFLDTSEVVGEIPAFDFMVGSGVDRAFHLTWDWREEDTRIRYWPNGGLVTAFVLTDTPTTVPEPSSLLLLGTGLIGLAGIRRKFKA